MCVCVLSPLASRNSDMNGLEWGPDHVGRVRGEVWAQGAQTFAVTSGERVIVQERSSLPHLGE